MERVVYMDNMTLRCGYTTGTCAAAAAQRAAALLLGVETPHDASIDITTPKGIALKIPVEEIEQGDGWVKCGVKKDSGDDPDVTKGIVIYAKVSKQPKLNRECTSKEAHDPNDTHDLRKDNSFDKGSKVTIAGGIGVGIVTKPGLSCPVGGPAINPVPKQMIEEQVLSVCRLLDYHGCLSVEISAPEGVDMAKRTYNPRLGIQGGISILGTSGIVEPMSEQALVDTIKVEMNVRKSAGAQYLVITPGNYGETFLKERMKISEIYTVKCSNFVGEALDYAELSNLSGVLLVGHIGKLVKVAAGIMNTHSKYGDARMETISAHAALSGGDQQVIEKLMNCITTDEAIQVLDDAGIREATIGSILKRLDFHIKERTHHTLEIGAMIFSNKYGYLGETERTENILKRLRGKD